MKHSTGFLKVNTKITFLDMAKQLGSKSVTPLSVCREESYSPTIALTSPAISVSTVSLYRFTSMIPFRIVSPTLAPNRTEPVVSNIEAKMHACLKVTTPEPTAVPNELATSFAPTENAKMKAIIKPKMTIHKYSSMAILENRPQVLFFCRIF